MLPIVYSCSGCSSAAQLTNQLALRLDASGLAQMSCIAGVGGGVPALVKLAQSGRPVLALDGCAMACVQHCLQRANRTPDHHLVLTQHGVKKRAHAPQSAELDRLWPLAVAAAAALRDAQALRV